MTGSITFDPILPWPLIATLFGIGAMFVLLGAVRRSRGMLLRLLVLSVLALALLDPRIIREERESRPDIAVVVVDESRSQNVGERRARTEQALAKLSEAAASHNDLELRVVRSTDRGRDRLDEGTTLFRSLDEALAEIPARRFAGAILITDGQVHDVPPLGKRESAPDGEGRFARLSGPMHVLLTGKRGERDRRLIVESTPTFGLVDKEVTVVYRVEDQGVGQTPSAGAPQVHVTVRRDGGEPEPMTVTLGRPTPLTFKLEHAGPTVVELEAEPVEGELSVLNNRSAVSINGVRDRLRVLLISGQPHAGERTWRNLLKSDPSVDLVHFTILRPPEKDDMTPLRELSLIVFPIQELFQVRLHEFNLIVFDRYIVRDVLPPSYFDNIQNYVRKGGALLVSNGPEFAGNRSLFDTPLGQIMPGTPTGQVIEQGFPPLLSELGTRHPVTASLPVGLNPARPEWGRWLRQVEVDVRSGQSLMEGVDNRPLLLLDRVEEGRVAQLMSDQTWLWARGYEGGGPYAELLRRVAHWLMKEPELEEERLAAHIEEGRLTIERGSLKPELPSIEVTTPSGEIHTLALTPARGGLARAAMPVEETGLYRVSDGEKIALAASGNLNPVEFADLRTTDEKLASVAQATGGGLIWLDDAGVPDLRRVRADRDTSGNGWIGLVRNEAFTVVGQAPLPLMPGLLILALALGGLMAGWYREGR